MRAIPGLELVEMKESVALLRQRRHLQHHPRGDGQRARRPQGAARHGDTATEVITANPGCLMQVRASLRRNGSTMRVRHIADLLDEAYGGAKTKRAIIGSGR